MKKIKEIVDNAMEELGSTLPSDQIENITKVIEGAVIQGILEGQHRAVDTCKECDGEDRDMAHKVATAIRRKNDVLIANLSSLR